MPLAGSRAFKDGRLRTGLMATVKPDVFAFNILLQNGIERQAGYERPPYPAEALMPRRTLLSPEQRARLFAIPTSPAEMARRHYVLNPEDLTLVQAKRRAFNRLGFAVQLCLLRHPGQGLGPGEQPPAAVLGFVAGQIGTSPEVFTDYARRDQTRREHAAELQTVLGLRSFRLSDWRDCLRIGAEAAWATDRGEPIVQAILAHLHAERVLIPDAAVLERIGLAARARARKRTFQALVDGLTDAQQAALDGLLVTDPALRRSRLAWLRDAPEAPAPTNMVALLDRLDWVRAVGIGPERARRIHAVRLTRLVEEGDIMTTQHLAGVEPLRRTALLVAQAADLETRLTDALLSMFSKYVGSLFTKARGRDERRFQATKRDVARTLLLFRRTIVALKRAQQAGEEGVAAVEREVGFAKLDQALPVIESVANVADVEILATAAERYAVLRRFSPRFLAAFRFQSNTPNDPLLAAIELLKEADQSGGALPKELPSAFLLPKWRRMIFTGTVPDRRLYETAVLAILRDRLRGADVWVAGSRNHRAFEDYLLPEEPAGAPPSGIGGEIDPERYVAARARLLHERLLFVAGRAGRGELDGVEIEDGSLYVARTKPTVPETARLLAGRLYGMVPRVRVTEVMGDVAQLTGFASCFTHLRTGYRRPTSRRCSRRFWPTGPTWACHAWPTRPAA